MALVQNDTLQYSEIYLHSSKFDSGSNNEPVYQLEQSIRTVKEIKVQSVVIPFTFYAINSNNDIFTIIETTGTSEITITLTNGNYTSSTFTALLKTLLEAESIANGNSLTYTVTVIAATNRLSISASGDFLVNVTNSKRITGFTVATTSAASAIATNTIFLAATNNLYLRSNLANFLQRDSVINNNLNYNNILKIIPLEANSGDIVYLQFSDAEYLAIETDITDLSFYVTDDDGFRVDFQGGEFTIVIQLKKLLSSFGGY